LNGDSLGCSHVTPESSIQNLFAEALEHAEGPERAGFLEEACGADPVLRRKLERLLRAHEQAGTFLAQPSKPAIDVPPEEMVPTEKPGERIGRYKLLQKIGEGGCGVVYMAEQEAPVRRRVALKIIKLGMDTKQVVARFEAERQALALMDHPNIAKVLDAGATESGRPYFVMELVRGTKVTEYCDEKQLAPKDRFQLFIRVCSAIQHAHQKGIIHRDLKPSNILVATVDGQPMPKVIDFGVAKATGGLRLTDKTLFTAFEQFVGTPAYMSPEQAEMSGVDIDTRSDIYSLGVVLYELLTGKTPFDSERLLRSGLDEIRRTIRETEPTRPSTCLRTLTHAELKTVATARQVEPPRLISLVRGDLDWVVMKCLEKERNRRYETAGALAADVQRFLNNEPVLARAPGNFYRFRKLVRRNRLAFGAAATLLTLLLLGIAITVRQAVRLKLAYTDIAMRVRLESQMRQASQLSERRAQAEAAKSRQVASFLQEMLAGVKPSVALGRDTTLLQEILNRTAARIESELKAQPDVEAELRQSLGDVYLALGAREQAQDMQRRALEIRRRLFGDANLETARSMDRLAMARFDRIKSLSLKLAADEAALREAIALETQALDVRTNAFSGDAPEIADSLCNLASMLREQGAWKESEALQRRALAIRERLFGNGSAEAIASLKELALVLSDENKQTEAEQILRSAIATTRAAKPAASLELADLLQQLGQVLRKGAKVPTPDDPGGDPAAEKVYQAAEISFQEAIDMRRPLLPAGHPALESSLSGLADIAFYHAQSRNINHGDKAGAAEKYEVAANAYREALPLVKKLYGENSLKTASCLANLAYVYWGWALVLPDRAQKMEKLAETEHVLRDSLAIRESLANQVGQSTSSNEVVGVVRFLLGRVLLDEERTTEALQMFTSAAENGSINSQRKLGDWYAKGEIVPKDEVLAAKWYRKAAEQGSVSALVAVLELSAGTGPAADPAEARKWLLKLSEGKDAQSLNALAWFRATFPDAAYRDGPQAIELAERADALSRHRDAEVLATLAAAYAETGNFEKAIAAQTEAMNLARWREQKQDYASRLKLFQARVAFHRR
jgi:eukaryotic-like serine/threonine-protein kinase